MPSQHPAVPGQPSDSWEPERERLPAPLSPGPRGCSARESPALRRSALLTFVTVIQKAGGGAGAGGGGRLGRAGDRALGRPLADVSRGRASIIDEAAAPQEGEAGRKAGGGPRGGRGGPTGDSLQREGGGRGGSAVRTPGDPQPLASRHGPFELLAPAAGGVGGNPALCAALAPGAG